MLVGKHLELHRIVDAGTDLGADLEDPRGVLGVGAEAGAGFGVISGGFEEGVGGEFVGGDPVGGGGVAADVEEELDGVGKGGVLVGKWVFEFEGLEPRVHFVWRRNLLLMI